MGVLHLSVLGTPEVFHDDTRLTFSLRKAQALLLYLAVEGGMHPRSKLAAFLWPDSESHDARTALRNALALLRSLLADADASPATPPHLLQVGDLLGLNPQAPLELDLQRVQLAYQQAQLSSTPPTEEQRTVLVNHLQQALSLVRGPFLDGFWLRDEAPFDEWLQQQQHQWQVRLQLLFDRLSSWYEAALEHEQAQAILTRWLALDPLQEEAYRRLMRVHLALGEPNAARLVYATCRARLAQALQVEPSPQTVALAGRIRATATRRSRGVGFATTSRTSAMAENGPPDDLFTPLVGRGAVLSQLVARYQQARQGQPQVVLVVGEAGMGKTRLAGEFVGWARAQGADVLTGQAWETGGRLPYQPLVEAIRLRLEEENAPEDLLDDLWLAELGRLLPEVRVRYPDLPQPYDDELINKVRLYEAVARLLEALAQRGGPLVLLLEDLHWVDETSLDLLRYLARDWSRHGSPVLLLSTAGREALELNSQLSARLAELGRDLPLTQVNLQALGQAEVLQLLEALVEQEEPVTGKSSVPREYDTVPFPPTEPQGQPVPASERPMDLPDDHQMRSWQRPATASERPLVVLGNFLSAQTGGQPLYLLEMLKLLRDQQWLIPQRGTDGLWKLTLDKERVADLPQERFRHELVPTPVRSLILTRLSKLSPAARQLVLASSVSGIATGAQRLWQIAEMEEHVGIEALEEAVGSGFLCEEDGWTDMPGRYRCTYDLIREVVYNELGTVRRRILQQRSLVLLHSENETGVGLAKPTPASR
ncbi:MAG TPA: AAA family ATPase [Ktedonobacteraceae bacterium]